MRWETSSTPIPHVLHRQIRYPDARSRHHLQASNRHHFELEPEHPEHTLDRIHRCGQIPRFPTTDFGAVPAQAFRELPLAQPEPSPSSTHRLPNRLPDIAKTGVLRFLHLAMQSPRAHRVKAVPGGCG